MSRNVPKKSKLIQRFNLKLPLNCWVFFDVAESTVEYCFDVWAKFIPFFIFLIVIWLWHPSGTPRNYKIMLVRAIIY